MGWRVGRPFGHRTTTKKKGCGRTWSAERGDVGALMDARKRDSFCVYLTEGFGFFVCTLRESVFNRPAANTRKAQGCSARSC